MKVHVLRLSAGDDLRVVAGGHVRRNSRARTASPQRASCRRWAACRSAVLRYADQSAGSETGGPLELLMLSGTLSADGAHLHASVADERGAVRGGHLMPRLHRAHHGGSGDRAAARMGVPARAGRRPPASRNWRRAGRRIRGRAPHDSPSSGSLGSDHRRRHRLRDHRPVAGDGRSRHRNRHRDAGGRPGGGSLPEPDECRRSHLGVHRGLHRHQQRNDRRGAAGRRR